ncbi:MAG: hypothetical protein ABIJ21_08470 [Nanoarchaeota archaeon]
MNQDEITKQWNYRNHDWVKEQIVQAKQEGQEELALGILLTYEDVCGHSLRFHHPLEHIHYLENALATADFDLKLCSLSEDTVIAHTYLQRTRWNDEATHIYLGVLHDYKRDLDAGRIVAGEPWKYHYRFHEPESGLTSRKHLWSPHNAKDPLTLEGAILIAEDGIKLAERILHESRKYPHRDYIGIINIEKLLPYFKRKVAEYISREAKEMKKTERKNKFKHVFGSVFKPIQKR